MKKNHSLGFSLIEQLLALVAIVGLISVVMYSARSTNIGKQTYGALGNLQSVMTVMNRIYGPAQKTTGAPYVGLTTNAIALQMSPEMRDSVGGIRNAFGGTVTMNIGNAYGTVGDSYFMGFTGIPASACTDFVGKAVGMSIQVGIGSAPTYVLQIGGAQPTGAQIVAACNTAAPTGYTTVYVTEL